MKGCKHRTPAQHCLTRAIFVYRAESKGPIPGNSLPQYLFDVVSAWLRPKLVLNLFPNFFDTGIAVFATDDAKECLMDYGGGGMCVAGGRLALVRWVSACDDVFFVVVCVVAVVVVVVLLCFCCSFL